MATTYSYTTTDADDEALALIAAAEHANPAATAAGLFAEDVAAALARRRSFAVSLFQQQAVNGFLGAEPTAQEAVALALGLTVPAALLAGA